MNSLTAHEVQQLVSLRLALDDALSRAKGAGKYRRGAAIVALDATVERASSIVAITRGITVPTNGKLDDLVSRLVQDFGPGWRPAVLPDIKHLRRARNASQHEGLEPDRDQVPLWASAAEAYVSGLIYAQFGVDVRRVVLSDAIRDVGLRERMREAEVSRDLGDHRSSVDKSNEAYQEALIRWKRLGGSRGSHFAPMNGEILDKKSYDYLMRQLGNLQGVLQSAAFSPDGAEAEWFMSTIAEQGNVLDADDAERVLAFAFEWIVEYERAAESWTPNRRHRTAVAQRLVRSEDRPARIDECTGVNLRNDQVRAAFRIADVPDEKEYPAWVQTLGELLSKHDQNTRWTVLDDGIVEISKHAENSPEMTDEVANLASALKEAHIAVQEKLKAAEDRARATQRRRSEYADSIKMACDDLPPWVDGIEVADGGFGGRQDQLLLTVQPEVLRLRFGQRATNSFYDDRKSLRDVFLNHELVQACFGTGGPNQLGILPILDAQQLQDVCKDIDITVSKQLEIDNFLKDQRNKIVVGLKASIAASLVNLE